MCILAVDSDCASARQKCRAKISHPAQVLDGFVRALNGLVHRVLDGRGGGAGEFDEFIDRVFHIQLFRHWNERLKNQAVG